LNNLFDKAFSALGQHGHAYQDYTEAIRILPSHRLYLMRGICLVFMEVRIWLYCE